MRHGQLVPATLVLALASASLAAAASAPPIGGSGVGAGWVAVRFSTMSAPNVTVLAPDITASPHAWGIILLDAEGRTVDAASYVDAWPAARAWTHAQSPARVAIVEGPAGGNRATGLTLAPPGAGPGDYTAIAWAGGSIPRWSWSVQDASLISRANGDHVVLALPSDFASGADAGAWASAPAPAPAMGAAAHVEDDASARVHADHAFFGFFTKGGTDYAQRTVTTPTGALVRACDGGLSFGSATDLGCAFLSTPLPAGDYAFHVTGAGVDPSGGAGMFVTGADATLPP